MSNSEEKSTGEVNVVSQSGPIRLELFDNRLNRYGPGFGQLRERVPPGLYLLRATAGTAQQERYLRVDAGQTLPTIPIDLPFASAAPVPGGSTSHEFHRYPAEALSRRRPAKAIGSGGCLMVFARTIDGDGRSPVTLEGLSLLDAEMRGVLDLAGEAANNPSEGWAGQCLELDPGGYVLRWRAPGDESEKGAANSPVAQSLFVARGWITIVFLAYNAEARRMERQSASIHMARIGAGFDANDVETNQAMELALGGLRTGNLVVPANLVNLLLYGKFQNPMLGIVGAHALLGRRQKDWALFETVLGNLENLIPGHPDVVGLRLMEKLANPAADGLRVAPLAWPPMLYAGYRALVTCDWTPNWRAEELIADGSMAEQAASRVLPESPWTCWLAPEAAAEKNKSFGDLFGGSPERARLLGQMARQVRDIKPALERIAEDAPLSFSSFPTNWLDPSDPALGRVSRYLHGLQQMGEVVDLNNLSLDDFRQLGLPVATVRKAIRTLLDAEEDEDTEGDRRSRQNQSAELTPYHSAYYAREMTRRNAADDVAKLSASLSGATVDLQPHQLDAALFAFRSPLARGTLLADEVGLGKTIEAGIVISQLWAERKRRILVITPATLRKQWAQELSDKFFLASQVLDTAEYNKLRRAGADEPLRISEGVFIFSYNFAATRESELRAAPWDLIVIDEAHRLRNVYKPGNKIAAAIRRASFGNDILLLTATPLQNNLLELYGLVSFIDKRVFGDKKSFTARYQQGQQLDDLRERLKSVCQRTLRRQVTEYVPFTNRIAETTDFTPTAAEQELYDKVSEYLQRESLRALPPAQRKLLTLVLRKLLASSTFAIAGTLAALAQRLESEAAAEILEEDFDALCEMAEEWAEDEDAESAMNSKPEIDPELQAEIDELKSYGALAASIVHNAKGGALLEALEKGFAKLAEIKARHRAVIFTESRRTQDYLMRLLGDHGYACLTINGTNADDRTGTIYRAWRERHAGEAVVTNNKAVDVRAAIVEHFHDHADILIATEAAAEGINLQFCSLVVNYDLPWNPQRIEQRIGRCHRYGQSHDVVVINFLNRANEADQRVFELLSEKFKLFEGVFGSSDEVLGALGSGVDFERRIAEIYQSCRAPDEIQQAFDELQRRLEEQIKTRLADTQRKLFEHFDDEVQQKLRLRTQLAEGQSYRDKFARLLWRMTKYELGAADAAGVVFEDAACRFSMDQPTAAALGVPAGSYQMLARGEQPAAGHHLYRFGDALAETLIGRAIKRQLPPVEIVFDYTAYREQNIWHKPKLSLVEKLIGQSGWLQLVHLAVASLGEEEHLLYVMIDDTGKFIETEIAEKLFLVDGHVAAPVAVFPELTKRLALRREMLQQTVLEKISRRDEQNFTAEMEKLDRWAEDKKLTLETEIKELDAELSEAKKVARRASDLTAKLELQRRVKDLEAKRYGKRHDLYDEQDKIDKIKDDLLTQTEAQLRVRITPTDIFTIRWRIV